VKSVRIIPPPAGGSWPATSVLRRGAYNSLETGQGAQLYLLIAYVAAVLCRFEIRQRYGFPAVRLPADPCDAVSAMLIPLACCRLVFCLHVGFLLRLITPRMLTQKSATRRVLYLRSREAVCIFGHHSGSEQTFASGASFLPVRAASEPRYEFFYAAPAIPISMQSVAHQCLPCTWFSPSINTLPIGLPPDPEYPRASVPSTGSTHL